MAFLKNLVDKLKGYVKKRLDEEVEIKNIERKAFVKERKVQAVEKGKKKAKIDTKELLKL